jgi:hypothetical protein
LPAVVNGRVSAVDDHDLDRGRRRPPLPLRLALADIRSTGSPARPATFGDTLPIAICHILHILEPPSPAAAGD